MPHWCWGIGRSYPMYIPGGPLRSVLEPLDLRLLPLFGLGQFIVGLQGHPEAGGADPGPLQPGSEIGADASGR